MQELYVKKINIRVNSSILDDFYKTSEYLHKEHRQNCYYDRSAPFKYIVKNFVEEFNEYPTAYWKNEVDDYTSKLKKDIQISIWLRNYYYKRLMRYCKTLEINRVIVIRSLMLKLIEETKVE